MDISSAIASACLPSSERLESVKLKSHIANFNFLAKQQHTETTEATVHVSKPIFQMNKFPVTLNADKYKNARSRANPNGDLRSAFLLRQLVDPVPRFEKSYVASPYSTEMIYKNVINGASIINKDPFISSILGNAKQMFAQITYPYLDGIPGEWRPIYASPEDWASAGVDRFKETNITIQNNGNSNNVHLIQGSENLEWHLGKRIFSKLHPHSKINSVRMKYLFVEFHRPWLDMMFFSMNNWYLSGQEAGFCSSGSNVENKGLLPLLPTGMLIARDISLQADWHKDDKKIIDEMNKSSEAGHLGPFTVSPSDDEGDCIQVIGWQSNVVPYSPAEDTP